MPSTINACKVDLSYTQKELTPHTIRHVHIRVGRVTPTKTTRHPTQASRVSHPLDTGYRNGHRRPFCTVLCCCLWSVQVLHSCWTGTGLDKSVTKLGDKASMTYFLARISFATIGYSSSQSVPLAHSRISTVCKLTVKETGSGERTGHVPYPQPTSQVEQEH